MSPLESIGYWSQIVRGAYLEIPELSLTRSQVQRFWQLDNDLSDTIVDSLVDARFLRQTPAGGFVRVRLEAQNQSARHIDLVQPSLAEAERIAEAR